MVNFWPSLDNIRLFWHLNGDLIVLRRIVSVLINPFGVSISVSLRLSFVMRQELIVYPMYSRNCTNLSSSTCGELSAIEIYAYFHSLKRAVVTDIINVL